MRLKIIAIVIVICVVSSIMFWYVIKENNENESNTFLFIQIWHHETGTLINGTGYSYLCIDFPTYHIDAENMILHDDFGALTNKSNIEVIVGSGSSLGGDVGSGAASGLTTYSDFPIHLNKSFFVNFTLDIISKDSVLINNSIILEPATNYSYYYNYTETGPDMYSNSTYTMSIQETITIQNYGLWPVSAIEYS